MFYELELTEFALALANARLGGGEVRWVDPASGESRRQSAALTGPPASRFAGREGALAHFAAIAALGRDLGHLDAYQGFLFLLEHITAGLSELVLQPISSGYSR